MKDQDEMFEAATETPSLLGCPSLGPKTLPGGFDGTGPGDRTAAVSAADRTAPAAEDGGGTEALKQRGAKLYASNERMRERIVEIAHLANECLLNTNHPTGYEPGQYGKDYRTYGKAIGQIRKLVKESIADVDPDYEMLALQFARNSFDFSKFQEALAAVASMKAEDFPGVYYTPGWLCELAKKLEANGTVPSASSPTGADKAKQDKFHRKHWTFCDGLFPISFVVTQEGFMERCTINGRKFKASVTQEDQLDDTTWNGYIYDNGKCVCMIGGMGKGKRCVMDMTHAAFKAYVKQLSGAGRKYHHGRGFLKQNAERARAAKAAAENGGQA